uniref:Flocculation protein FLO11-like n=1 Tax=Caenorhabditis tropicalis TaxID=1561998 RepID=A0A1I7TA41_9PELO
MANRPRRGVAAAAAALKKEKEMKKEVKEEAKVVEDEENDVQLIEDDDDDDGPPPLEREQSCGENEDTDGELKEEDVDSSPKESQDAKCDSLNLLEALSCVFSADGDSSKSNKKPRGSPSNNDSITSEFLSASLQSLRGTKSLSLNKTPLSTPSVSSNSSIRLIPLRESGMSSGIGTRKHGVPPPLPKSLQSLASNNTYTPAGGVGSNTSLGPARIIEKRNRDMENLKRTSLSAYNGGEKFPKIAKFSSNLSGASSSTSTTAADVHSMLRNQSPVRMQVTVGGDHKYSNGDSLQETMEMASAQKESIGSIMKSSSNQSLLLGSMIMNGLNTLRNTDDYHKFSGDLFDLLAKYNIQ